MQLFQIAKGHERENTCTIIAHLIVRSIQGASSQQSFLLDGGEKSLL